MAMAACLRSMCRGGGTGRRRLSTSFTAMVRTPHPDTVAAHAGCEVDVSTGAITPPIHLSSTFERDADIEVSLTRGALRKHDRGLRGGVGPKVREERESARCDRRAVPCTNCGQCDVRRVEPGQVVLVGPG